jgi:hypothetical protein
MMNQPLLKSVCPTGPPITKNIGPAGGVLTSADNMLTLTVPPDAVKVNTPFSIEPIENFCPGGMRAYRLLPAGMTFTKPVTITFHYTADDLEGTLSALLDIAYQESDGIWYALSGIDVDEQSKTISVGVKHFTDWTNAAKLRIEPRTPAIPVIKKGATYNLHLAGAKDSPPKVIPAGPGEVDDLPMLPKKKHVPFTATWYVNGVPNGNANVGTITIDNKTNVTYHAPAKVPANNPVLVTAELTDFEAWVREKKEVVKLNKVICAKRIKIKPDAYDFTFEMDADLPGICGIPGATYHDKFTMDVQVMEVDGQDMVYFFNPVNQDAEINPSSFKNGDCTVSCPDRGPGFYNVTSYSGVASIDDDQLVLTIGHTSTSAPKISVACKDYHNETGVPFPAHQRDFTFKLSAEGPQIIAAGGGILSAKLTPK